MRILLTLVINCYCFVIFSSCGFDKQLTYRPKVTDSLYRNYGMLDIYKDSVFDCEVLSNIFYDNKSLSISFRFDNKNHSKVFIKDIQGSFDSVNNGHRMLPLKCKLVYFNTGRRIITDYFLRNMILDTALYMPFNNIPNQYRTINDSCCRYDIEMNDPSKAIINGYPRKIVMHIYFKVAGEKGYSVEVSKDYILYKKREYTFWILRDD